ncbi:MAG: hypothetical protein ABI883_07105 [Chthoniobacterales bacterium]
MKLLTKLTLAAVAATLLGSGVSFADDQQLQNRLAIQRVEAAKNERSTTVAVFAGDRGVGRSAGGADDQRAETRFELRTNAHGQTFGVFVPER